MGAEELALAVAGEMGAEELQSSVSLGRPDAGNAVAMTEPRGRTPSKRGLLSPESPSLGVLRPVVFRALSKIVVASARATLAAIAAGEMGDKALGDKEDVSGIEWRRAPALRFSEENSSAARLGESLRPLPPDCAFGNESAVRVAARRAGRVDKGSRPTLSTALDVRA